MFCTAPSVLLSPHPVTNVLAGKEHNSDMADLISMDSGV